MNEPFSEELISAYLDDELTSVERERVEQWLAASPDHQRVFEDLRQLRCDLQALPRPSLPAGFRDRVLNAIETRFSPVTSEFTGQSSTPSRQLEFPTNPPVANAQPLESWQWYSAGLAATLLLGFIALFSQRSPTTYTLTQAAPSVEYGTVTEPLRTEEHREQLKNAISERDEQTLPAITAPADEKTLLPELAGMKSSADRQSKQLADTRRAVELRATEEPATNGSEFLGAPKVKMGDELAPAMASKRDSAAGLAANEVRKSSAKMSERADLPSAPTVLSANGVVNDAHFLSLPEGSESGVLEVYVTTPADQNVRDWFAQRVAAVQPSIQQETKKLDELGRSSSAPAAASLRTIPSPATPKDSDDALGFGGGSSAYAARGAVPQAAKKSAQVEPGIQAPSLEWDASPAEVQSLLTQYREAFPKANIPVVQYIASAETNRNLAEPESLATNRDKGASSPIPFSTPKAANNRSLKAPANMEAKPALNKAAVDSAAFDSVVVDKALPIVTAEKSGATVPPLVEKPMRAVETPAELAQGKEQRKMELDLADPQRPMSDTMLESVKRPASSPAQNTTTSKPSMPQLPSSAVAPGASSASLGGVTPDDERTPAKSEQPLSAVAPVGKANLQLKVRFIFVPDGNTPATLEK